MTNYITKTLLLIFSLAVLGVSPGYALTFSEAQKLLASDGAADDRFGEWAVSISGDTAVIGAHWDDDNGFQSGSAYVFIRDGAGVWHEQQKLTASDGEAADLFGWAVSISGDTAVIGAYSWHDNVQSPGSAYVFVRNGVGVWSEQQKLTASDGAGADSFGWAVSISGDTAVIGARYDDYNGASSGSAYVFIRDGAGVWHEQQKLTASDGTAADLFGWAVSISGDTTVIGALFGVHDGIDSGSAYVFVRDGAGVWSEQQKLTASDGAGSDSFGWAVSISGDTAVIGALYDDDNGTGSGSAYVFIRDGTGVWSQQQKLTASDGAANDLFGYSVSISGDTAVIGAHGDYSFSGSAYVFVRAGTGLWHEQQKLTAIDWAGHDSFGISVSISGGTVVIGASEDDDNGYNSGSAYVFEANAIIFQEVKSLGDINADGSEDIAVLVNDAAAGTVTATVKDAEDDHLIKAISFNPNRIPVAFEVMADIDGNGAPELVVLGQGSVDVEIRDSLSGILQNTVSFSPTRAPIDLAILADQNGNGIPELAVLTRSSASGAVSVVVKDALTNQYLNYVGFSSNFTPLELAVIADLNGNAKVEFAVLGVEATTAGHDKVEIRDSATDAVLNNVFYSPTVQAKRLVVLPDQNNTGVEELAVLREGRYVIVQINDALSDSLVNHLGYNPSFKYSQVLVIPDLNGNGVPEIGVLGTDPTHGQLWVSVQVADAKTGVKISNVYFSGPDGLEVFKPQGDVAVVNDINGNGSAELAYLGKRESDGKLRVFIRDALTRNVINKVDF